MKLIFRDLNPLVCSAVAETFADIPAFDVKCAHIFSVVQADAIVSPANAHGWMDGGIDRVYMEHFGAQIETTLQGLIAQLPTKLLAVGEAMIVFTGDDAIPRMIAAPTMEIPGNVAQTDNAYLAFRAVLRAARRMDFHAVLCPGLATMTGRMSPETSARQMRRAWNELMGLVPAQPVG